MSVSVCFYFQVHQPYRLRKDYSFFNIGPDHDYYDEVNNKAIMRKVAEKCYLPANKTILKLIKKFKGKFKVSYSISGMALDQFKEYAPEVIDSFKELVDTGCVELLNETYYHSLAFIKSREEFTEQVQMHKNAIEELFGVTPTTFRNTELIYNNELAEVVQQMGYKTILSEGADQILKWRTPNFVYSPKGCSDLKLLLKNYKLSDDIAFRFSNKNWNEYPLTVKKYTNWLHNVSGNGDVINLFMDYETFGEHQWKETGIFKFLKKLPKKIMSNSDFIFQTPSEVAATYQSHGEIDAPNYISWADEERDLSAWMGNSMQDSIIDFAYSLEKPVKATQDPSMIHTWRKLLSSDHSYYACTKWENDGDVHSYFSPFNSPHDAYIVYSNVLNDLKLSLKKQGMLSQQ